MDSNDLVQYMSKLWNFSAMASLIMTFVVYNILSEDKKFVDSLRDRYWGMAPHGSESLTYGSQVSMISLSLIFLSNFSIALIYCQIFESSSFEMIFVVPMMMQLVILFYQSKMLGIQLRILSIDLFSDHNTQNDWLSWTQIKICK